MKHPVRDISKYDGEIFDYLSVEDFLAKRSFSSGLHVISLQDGIYLEFLWRDFAADTTVVIFNGAGYPSDMKRPGFSVTGVMGQVCKQVAVNALFVHDPTLYVAPTLSLAWYSGALGLNTQGIVDDCIRHLVSNSRTERVAFFGVSGGGFASLRTSARFPESVAIACIPQVILPEYEDWAVERYYELCWGIDRGTFRAGGESVRELPFTWDLRGLYEDGVGNYPLLLLNSSDNHHVDIHAAKFVEACPCPTPVVMRTWGDGHVGPLPDFFVDMLVRLVECAEWSSFEWADGAVSVNTAVELKALAAARPDVVRVEHDSTVSLGEASVRLPFPHEIFGTLEVIVALECDGDLRGQDALIALRGDMSEAWDAVGLHFNPAFEHSPFLYLATRPGSHDVKIRVRIPRGSGVRGLEVIGWNPQGKAQTVRVLRVSARVFEDQ